MAHGGTQRVRVGPRHTKKRSCSTTLEFLLTSTFQAHRGDADAYLSASFFRENRARRKCGTYSNSSRKNCQVYRHRVSLFLTENLLSDQWNTHLCHGVEIALIGLLDIQAGNRDDSRSDRRRSFRFREKQFSPSRPPN